MILNLPQFIVLGGHKCGTSSLHSYLEQHPEICMPNTKGVDFFSREENRKKSINLDAYKALYDFSNLTTQKVAGEVSSVYLYSESACELIKTYLPNAKLIIILRNPAKRAISHFYNLPETKKRNNRNISEIFNEKHLLQLGYYSEYLKMYLDKFPSEHLKIYLFDSLIQKSDFKDFFKFINVNSQFQPDTSIVLRKGGTINSKQSQQLELLRSTIGQVIKPFISQKQRRSLFIKTKNLLLKKANPHQEVENKLMDLYQKDIHQLENLLKIDLSSWRNS